jgi:broad specificity phosphatase PhoE
MEQYPNAVCEEWPAHEFTYLSPAKCQNTTQADRSSSVTSYWKRNDPFYCDGAGAESFTDLIGRATDVIARLRECEGPVIAIFSHQQFIAALQWINESGGRMSSARMRDFKCFLNARSLENGGILQLVM